MARKPKTTEKQQELKTPEERRAELRKKLEDQFEAIAAFSRGGWPKNIILSPEEELKKQEDVLSAIVRLHDPWPRCADTGGPLSWEKLRHPARPSRPIIAGELPQEDEYLAPFALDEQSDFVFSTSEQGRLVNILEPALLGLGLIQRLRSIPHFDDPMAYGVHQKLLRSCFEEIAERLRLHEAEWRGQRVLESESASAAIRRRDGDRLYALMLPLIDHYRGRHPCISERELARLLVPELGKRGKHLSAVQIRNIIRTRTKNLPPPHG